MFRDRSAVRQASSVVLVPVVIDKRIDARLREQTKEEKPRPLYEHVPIAALIELTGASQRGSVETKTALKLVSPLLLFRSRRTELETR